jgi:hypothetical protein
MFEYLEMFHNRPRRHAALGSLTPVEFEIQAPTTVAEIPASDSGGTRSRPDPSRRT